MSPNDSVGTFEESKDSKNLKKNNRTPDLHESRKKINFRPSLLPSPSRNRKIRYSRVFAVLGGLRETRVRVCPHLSSASWLLDVSGGYSSSWDAFFDPFDFFVGRCCAIDICGRCCEVFWMICVRLFGVDILVSLSPVILFLLRKVRVALYSGIYLGIYLARLIK